MVRRQKLISMTDEHFEVACEMPNFSKWVREKIEEYIQDMYDVKSHMRLYVCPNGHEELLEPVESRLRGTYWPIERQCSECTYMAVRQ